MKCFILTRHTPQHPNQIQWDGKTTNGWGHLVNEVDAVVNLTGFGLEHWPWTKRQKQKFIELSRHSRTGACLRYTKRCAPPARFPAIFRDQSLWPARRQVLRMNPRPLPMISLHKSPIPWEAATQPVEELGVRRVIITKRGGSCQDEVDCSLSWRCATRLFFGGKFGDGKQAMPWIHATDHTNAMRFLLENENASWPVQFDFASNRLPMRNLCAPLPKLCIVRIGSMSPSSCCEFRWVK